MRGARDKGNTKRRRHGIIPAYAGSTGPRASSRWTRRDHPRVCGEHNSIAFSFDVNRGSSPRMRGAPVGELRVRAADGIIPAYAGSTRLSLVVRRPRGDHPRVCGEHCRPLPAARASRGSSPRMRGARRRRGHRGRREGIIPAYAGSTPAPGPLGSPAWDHPRVCGEHSADGGRDFPRDGSSPRMRGAPRITFRPNRKSGIIPAYAGSTGTP